MNCLTTQNEFTLQEFKSLSFSHMQLENKVFTTCVFTKCSFHETTFSHCEFQDCVFRHCDLSLAILKKCTFKNTRFEDSQVVGINWCDTNLTQKKYLFSKPVEFLRCALNHSTFMGLNLKNIIMSKCIARDVSFEEADLSQTDCTFTDFTDSRFSRTNLTEADFTGAMNYSIAASLNTLKKTKFSLPEAMSLLYGLDIILTERPLTEADN
jgi:fluoroquinolone resistance protein